MQTSNTSTSELSELLSSILSSMGGLCKAQLNFLTHLLPLLLSIRGKINFLQLQRYGIYSERSYRRHYARFFNWLGFNKALSKKVCKEECIVAFDPVHLKKSGSKTYGRDRFWSGTAKAVHYGLELGELAVIDVQGHSAYHLEAVQTPSKAELGEGKSRIDHYAALIAGRAETIKQFTDTIVVDGFFFKEAFVDAVRKKAGLHLVGLMRADAAIKLYYSGKQKGCGRPRKYQEGKLDVKAPKGLEPVVSEEENISIFTGVVYAKALKQKVRIVLMQYCKAGEVVEVKLLYSTNTALSAEKIIEYYQLRFQIEFLFRDAKQHTGLEHCQARSKEKIHFHANAALTAVSLAKAAYRDKESNTFSMANVKTLFHNHMMLQRLFSIFEIDRNQLNLNHKINQFVSIGRIAA